MRRQPVCRVHEDFGDAPSFLNSLQLEPEQVVVDTISLKRLNRAGKNKEEISIDQVETDKKLFSLILCSPG